MDVLTVTLFIAGFLLVISGADFLVKGASKLAIDLGISPLVVGLTIVAYGTSAPELAVSVQAMFEEQPDLSLGNVVGSNITNILLVLGLAAVYRALPVSKQIMKIDLPLMLGVSFGLFIAVFDGRISNAEGALMIFGGIAYTWYTIWKSRKDEKAKLAALPPDLLNASPAPDLKSKILDAAYLVLGCVMLIAGSNFLVDSAIDIAHYFGVSEIIIGLTIIAIGTSLPEVATTFVAGAKGELDIALGNAIGSNIFNILTVLGVASIVTSGGMTVSPVVVSTDVPLMIGVALLCAAVIFNGYIIRRSEGVIFLAYFVFYLLYLLGRSSEWQAQPVIHAIFWYGLLPATVLYFGAGIYKTIKKPRVVDLGLQPIEPDL